VRRLGPKAVASPITQTFDFPTSYGVTISGDGHRVVATDFISHVARWDVATGDVASWHLPCAGARVRLSDDGSVVAMACASTLSIWHPDTNQLSTLRGDLHLNTDPADSVALSDGGTYAALTSVDGQKTEVIDLRSGHQILRLAGGGGSLAISPDGHTLALGLEVYDLTTATPLGDLRLPQDVLSTGTMSVGFSHDGRAIVAWGFQACGGSSANVVALWDAKTLAPIGRPICTYADQIGVTANADTIVGVQSQQPSAVTRWDLRPQAWVPIACSIANRNLTRGEWTRYLGDTPYTKTCPQFALEP
jgi:WD40 repeat protein